jgi:hypothetical protein
MLGGGGKFYIQGSQIAYQDQLESNTTILYLVDFEAGNLKAIVDGKDKGWALENNELLKSGAKFFITISTRKGEFKLEEPLEVPEPEVIEEEVKVEEIPEENEELLAVSKLLGLNDDKEFMEALHAIIALHVKENDNLEA